MIGLVIVLLSLGIVSGQEKLRIYALPVGQGEALVLQCPKGDVTIVDMGKSGSSDFWNKDNIKNFFITKNLFNKVKNIVITHNDKDHYNLIPEVFADISKLSALRNIYISRNSSELDRSLEIWISRLINTQVQTINYGNAYCCKPTDTSCRTIDLCPGDGDIKAEVLFANLGDKVKTNENSIVLRITYNKFSLVLNGDFTGIPRGKCGPENKVDLYERMKDTTVYKLAHHGSSNGANNAEMLSVIKPKAIFVSANSWYGNLGHPRCSVINFLKDNVKTLCKPKSIASDPFYCGGHPYPNADILQEKYTCCDGQYNCKLISNNEYAIYSTAPDEDTINLIELVTNGTIWGFINEPKAKSDHTGTTSKPVTRPTATKPVTRPTATKPVTRPTATKRPSVLTNPTPKKPKTRRRNLEIASFLRRLMLGEKEIPIIPNFE